MTIQTPLWEFVDISKAYPGVLANDKVNIKLLPGSIHGLLGENGCGKSTMIKTLSGVQQPDSGTILHNGHPTLINDPQMARDFGIATVFSGIFNCTNAFSRRKYIFGEYAPIPVWNNRLGPRA